MSENDRTNIERRANQKKNTPNRSISQCRDVRLFLFLQKKKELKQPTAQKMESRKKNMPCVTWEVKSNMNETTIKSLAWNKKRTHTNCCCISADLISALTCTICSRLWCSNSNVYSSLCHSVGLFIISLRLLLPFSTKFHRVHSVRPIQFKVHFVAFIVSIFT